MNKKGFLLEKSVLELILTIIGILLILVVVVYLFGLVSTAQVKRNAQTSLDILSTRANSLQEGKMVVARLPGLCKESNKQCDWFIAGWSKNDTDIPEQHLLKNVICVCKGEPNNQARYCSSLDSCREIKEASYIIVGPSQFNGIVGGAMGGGAMQGKIPYSAIPFGSNLIEVEISKNNGVVSFKKIG
ncbi:MAG: hypothetical protein Q7R87_04790 [Nanoarchaeota archaeon]|nr:hypothetical protein [Nanoarchaeota archaeon]